MPTYVYRCKSCNYEFEEFQSMSADPLVICPKCAAPSLKRLLSAGGGLVFKGNGFYLTDYKNSGSSSTSSGSSGASKSNRETQADKEVKKEVKTAVR